MIFKCIPENFYQRATILKNKIYSGAECVLVVLILFFVIDLKSQGFNEDEIIEKYVLNSLVDFKIKSLIIKDQNKEYKENFKFILNDKNQIVNHYRIYNDIIDSAICIYDSNLLKDKETIKHSIINNKKIESTETNYIKYYYDELNKNKYQIITDLESTYIVKDTFIYNIKSQLIHNKTIHNQGLYRGIFGDSTWIIDSFELKSENIYRYDKLGNIVFKSEEIVGSTKFEIHFIYDTFKLVKKLIKYPARGICNRYSEASIDYYDYIYNDDKLSKILKNGILFSNYEYDKKGLLIKTEGNTNYKLSYEF